MVNITDVKQILQFAIDAEIKVFLDGGWGVDALLGTQSRAHNDIEGITNEYSQTRIDRTDQQTGVRQYL